MTTFDRDLFQSAARAKKALHRELKGQPWLVASSFAANKYDSYDLHIYTSDMNAPIPDEWRGFKVVKHLEKTKTMKEAEAYEAFMNLVEEETTRSRKLHPAPCHNLHEGYGVLLEEVDEFWDLVKMKKSARDPTKVLEELVQIASYASRIAVELGLVTNKEKA